MQTMKSRSWRVDMICYVFVLLFVAVTYVEGSIFNKCGQTQFQCANHNCIPKSWQCDNDDDCGDNSDEANCPKKVCGDSDFKCSNDSCIPEQWQCDGEPDCPNGSDEEPDLCKDRTCSPDQFSCGHGSICIPQAWKCDGQDDCPNKTDEKDCPNKSCESDEFQCANGHCIDARWRCDQDKDCDDGSDENGDCPDATCGEDQFTCKHSGRCIPNSWQCDGDVDCQDGSDEDCQDASATTSPCSEREFTCSDHECIPKSWKCDGDFDCTDHSDEAQCPHTTCPDNRFRCDSGQCIWGIMECDGKPDCDDSSDETHCPTAHPSQCDQDTEFDCTGTGDHCIPLDQVCDRRNDCGMSQDENQALCHRENPCDSNNAGCSHFCNFTYVRHFCSCPPGYKISDSDPTLCVDVNECKIHGMCSQDCVNSVGSYKCQCREGYKVEPSDPHMCKALGEEPLLLFANRMDVRTLSLHTGHYKSVVADTRSAIAIDYDFQEKVVYWSDVALEKINKMDIVLSKDPKDAPASPQFTTVVEHLVSTPDGLAFDWVHKNLYWTDTGRNTIEVISVAESHRTTLINTQLDEPRALVLDPRDHHGWMYWTDWGEHPKIEKAGMDGSHRSTVIGSDIQWPNGLTIDYETNQLFWVDAKLHVISSSDLRGNSRRVILTDQQHVKHPFAITVFEDYLYWTDWETESIHKVNKFSSDERGVSSVAMNLFSPMDVRVFHPVKQPAAVNVCANKNGGCSHMCLRAPKISEHSSRVTCKCPDGMQLDNDGKTCLDSYPGSHIPARSTQPTTSAEDKTPLFNDGSSDNHVKAHPREDPSDKDVGKIAGMVVGILVVVAIIITVIALIIYRSVMKRNVRSMNFDNPVYRKTTEDQFSLEKNQYQPSKTYPSTLEPLTATSHEIA